MSESLVNLCRRYRLDPEKARRTVLVPTLVWETSASGQGKVEHWMMTETGPARATPRRDDSVIFLVQKVIGKSNAFAMGVTLGRVDSNDIVIDDRSVSRFHAWVQHNEREHCWTLTDAESKNGTWLDGVKLAPRTATILKDGAAIRLGDTSLRFFLPEGLFRYIDEKWNALNNG